jgi:4-alpha-glucanotransferase
VEKALGGLPFLAEDLGLITPDVITLRDKVGIAGTRVLQFAFDGHADNPYLPENYVTNAVVYTGTHDNPTTRGWYEDLPDWERNNLWRYLKRAPGRGEEVASALLAVAWSSPAALAMAPLQDVLNLGKEARMNQPGSPEGNWRWRCTDEMLSAPGFDSLKDLTRASGRAGASVIC